MRYLTAILLALAATACAPRTAAVAPDAPDWLAAATAAAVDFHAGHGLDLELVDGPADITVTLDAYHDAPEYVAECDCYVGRPDKVIRVVEQLGTTSAPNPALYQSCVVAHEMAHAVGVKHTAQDPGSLMAPFVAPTDTECQWSAADQAALDARGMP